MKNWHFILLLAVAFALTPSEAFACGEKTCKKEMSDTKSQKSCCGTGNHSKNDHSGCNGKCGNSSCVNPIAPVFANITSAVEFGLTRFEVSVDKPQFSYLQPRVSTGYYTIWLIPKISLS